MSIKLFISLIWNWKPRLPLNLPQFPSKGHYLLWPPLLFISTNPSLAECITLLSYWYNSTFLCKVEINEVCQMRASCSYLLRAFREVSLLPFGKDSKAGRGVWNLHREKGKSSAGLPLKVLAWGSRRRANKCGILCNLFEEYIWLSWVGPELEVGAKIREADSYRPSPDHFGANFCGSLSLTSWAGYFRGCRS